MKLTYRGISYDYNPPAVNVSDSPNVGKYRGLDVRFRNPVKAFVQQPTLDLKYRGVALHPQPMTAVVEAAPETAPVTPVAAPVTASVRTAESMARSLMMDHTRTIKRRQQVMLTRLAAEVGLDTDDASHYWNRIQGKVHPSFRATYDRSHVAMS